MEGGSGPFLRGLRLACLAIVGLSVGVGLSRPPQSASSARRRPNVLLVSIDSLRADHVHAYGYARPTTPTIDALAAGGVLFRTVVSSSSWTVPAHMTLLTALPPERHGVTRAWSRLASETTTLAEVLRDAGYATAGFVSAPTVRALYGFDQGFEVYDDKTAVAPSRKLSSRGITAPKVVAITQRWLDDWARRSPRPPFFVFLHLWDVHYDYAPPPPYDTLFDPDYRGAVTSADFESNPALHAGMAARDLEHLVALYDGEIRHTDEWLGRLLRSIHELGAEQETIVVVTSDHGDEFFEHGKKGHAKSLYDEIVLVPLVVNAPGRVRAGQVVDRQVRLMDVAPTILSLAGVVRPNGFGALDSEPAASRDVTPWITASNAREGEPTSQAGSDRAAQLDLPAFSHSEAMGREMDAVRMPDHKLIRDRGPGNGRELFDLTADPRERRNLAAGGVVPERGLELEAGLDAWVAAARLRRPVPERVDLDADQTDRLRALGYLP